MGLPASPDDAGQTAEERIQGINAVFGLLLILTQASTPDRAMQLVTTAVPSIAPRHTAVAWHPGTAGSYYQQAPGAVAAQLGQLTGPGPIELAGAAWAFPLTAALGRTPVFLITSGPRDLSEEEIFLLSVLAQMCGTVVANHELRAESELRAQAARDRDIAQARATELTASEARQRAVLEAALDAVVTIDSGARIRYVNSAFEQTFGYRAADVIGRDLAEVIVPPALRSVHRAGFAHHLATGEARILDRRIEVSAVRADGTEFPAEVTVTRTGLPGEPSFTGYVRDITERQHAQQELMDSRARLVAASDAARQQVTRDLHDGAQQWFVTSLINLQLAEQKWDAAPERARELLGLATRDARNGIADLREIAAGLLPAILTQRGLAAAISSLAARLPVTIHLDVPDQRLPAAVEVSVYFFCSEGLTNVVKHAHAASAWVQVSTGEGQCTAEVRDDGTGGAWPRAQSSGLTGLRDRIGALGGTMEILSPESGGTTLRAVIPLPA
ncbi:MAG: PAS domain S-box protein [Actinobacteria bacterium]|nr:PAS domain S-box protein [Actinomycetota bacterium]